MKKWYLSISFLLLLVSFCKSENNGCYQFSIVSEGLNSYSGNMTGLLKDSNNYIWYHSQGDLFKYNGKKWERINIKQEDDNLDQIIVNGSLKEDNYGNLWLGNKAGLYYYISHRGQVNSLSTKYPASEIFSADIHNIVVYSDHKIFFIANSEPYLMQYSFNAERKELENVTVAKLFQRSSPDYYLMTLAPDGNIWVLGNEHAILYNPKLDETKEVRFSSDLKLDGHKFLLPVVYTSKDWVIWIGTQNHGLATYDIRTGTLNHFPSIAGKKIRLIKDIVEDNVGNIWVSSTNGLIRIDMNAEPGLMKLIEGEEEAKSLYIQYINSMYANEEGYILMVTLGGEIIKLENCVEVFKYLPFNKQFNVAPVYSVYATTRNAPGGEILKISSNSIVSQSIRRKNEDVKQKEYLTYSKPSDLIRDFNFIDGNLWVGSIKTGFAIYDPITKQRIVSPELNNLISFFEKTVVVKIIKCSESKAYLINNNGEVFFLSKKNEENWQWKKIDFQFSSLNLFIAPFLTDSEGWVWTADPLNRLLGFGTDGEIHTVQLNSKQQICSLCKGPGNSLLIGLFKGLLKLNKNTWELSSFDVFNDISIFNIIQSDSTKYWLTSHKKLYRLNEQTGKVDIISNKNGLPECRFQANSSIRLKNGDLGFGTLRKGIMHFSPSDVSLLSRPLSVKITGMKANGESVVFKPGNSTKPWLNAQYPLADKVKFNHNHKLLTIQFSALDYIQGESVKYFYYLDGVDEDWNMVGSNGNEVTYSNLTPGTYTFRVKATATPGIWNEEETRILVEISPAWFQTRLAKILFLMTFFSLIVFFWWYSIGKVKLKEQLKREKLERDREKEVNKMKLQFFTNISHEFKTPLSLLYGPLKQLQNKEIKSEKEKDNLFELMSRNIKYLMDMIDQLMDFRKVENKAMKLRVRPTNISHFIEDEFHRFKEEADLQQKVLYHETKIEEPVFGWVDSEKLSRILSNLLSNAIKYTTTNGIIRLRYKVQGNGMELKVCDNGIGIEEKFLPHIFERYYRVEDIAELNKQVSGTGIGLALCRELANIMKGKITVHSTPGKGTCFHFWFPISASYFKEVEKEKRDVVATKNKDIIETEIEFTSDSTFEVKDKPLLLIVEDNKDMQTFLEGILKNDYAIAFANNGYEGIEKSNELSPNLVVADVMMPEMDGFEMVKRLKTDIRISHIPIILLTALSSPEHQIEGVQSGADFYIKKPFDPEFLKISIGNLIESRIKLRQKFGKKFLNVKTKEITITKTDEVFFDKITTIIGERLFDPEFRIEELLTKIGMSSSQFYRKIKALTDQNPKEFIKSQRLKKATELLKETSMRVSEICYAVGFTDPKYFGKVFRKHFGISPSEYSKKE